MRILNFCKFRKIAMCVLGALISTVFAFAQEKKSVDVMFTHDVHSFLDNIARAKTLIDQQKEKNPDTIVVDAGDFSQGTLYQTVFETQAAEIRTLGLIGVEATTMGNHEFDRGDIGLANMFNVARASGDILPAFVLCNADWSKTDDYTQTVKKAYDNFGGKDYVIIQKGDVKIALFGLFGENSLFCAPTCKLTFINQYEAAQKTVAEIKSKENPDLIICLSHGGTDENPKKSEDEILAKKVPDIDLIISGHTHSKLEKPIQHGNTYVVSCEAYCAYLGSLGMTQLDNGRWEITRYELLPVDETVTENAQVRAKLDAFNKEVDRQYLSKFGFTSKQVLGNAEASYTHSEMAHVISAMYKKAVEKYEIPGTNPVNTGYGTPVDLAVVPTGVVREELKKGPITAQDVFTAFSLGIGPDRITGYPLVSVYLTGKEIKNACEIDCSMGKAAGISLLELYFAGVTYEYNPHRMLLDKVTKMYLINCDGTKTPIEEKKLYRVVSDIYTGNMLGSVNDLTYGLLSLIPKNADGSVIENLEDNIIRVDVFPEVSEFKGWAAIAKGIQMEGSLGDYADVDANALVSVPSRNLFKIMAHPSKFAGIVYGIIFGLIGVIVVIVVLCVCLKKRKRRK